MKVKTEDGENIATGLYARIGGSRHPPRRLVPVPSMMGLVRWESHVVLRYLKYAILVNITGEYRRGLTKIRITSEHANESCAIRINGKALEKLTTLEDHIKTTEDKLRQLAAEVDWTTARVEPMYIVGNKYRRWHLAFPWRDVGREE